MPECNIGQELARIRYYLGLLKKGPAEKEEKSSKAEDHLSKG